MEVVVGLSQMWLGCGAVEQEEVMSGQLGDETMKETQGQTLREPCIERLENGGRVGSKGAY